ncbi:MAG: alpha/beta hydrolase [Chloroflexi bacterium]|nr:alpha/beta hydrolase [Chloroflexota bacterium]
MPFFEVDGQKIFAHEEGSGRNLAIMIHGWSSSWFAVSPLIPYLSQRYRCLAVDLPGYGESPALPDPVTIESYADLIAGLIRQETSRPAILVGHSMGGMTSITLALKYPDLVERMILLCPTVSGILSWQINVTLSPFVFLERFPVISSIISVFEPMVGITDRLLRPTLFADQTGITMQDYEKIRSDTRRRDQGRVRAECFRAMRNNDLREQLDEVKPPALVIWGMEDNTVPLRDASAVARQWPDADLRIIPNAGHWPQFETPEITERYVRAFVGKPVKLLTLDLDL